MIFYSIFRTASYRSQFLSTFRHFNSGIYFSLKARLIMNRMEIQNSVITKPYENGIVDINQSNLKWYSKESDIVVPRPIVICGPSGSGKSTLLKELLKEYSDCMEFSISHTTRKPRFDEKHGKHYYFVDKAEMEDSIARGEFLEYTEFSGNYYGTSKSELNRIQSKGKMCFLDLEINGVKNVKMTNLKPKFVFIKPPSLEVLEDRLRKRNTETEESIRKRLNRAGEEMKYGETPGNFDYVIVNDDVEKAAKQLKNYLLQDLEMVRNQYQ